MKQQDRINQEIIKRLTAIEELVGIDNAVDPEHPGTGRWKLSTYNKHAEGRKELPEPEPSWKREAATAAEKLRVNCPHVSLFEKSPSDSGSATMAA